MEITDIAIIFGLMSPVIAIATFYLGRISNAKKEGADIAIMKSDIEHIKDNTKEIKESLQNDLEKHDESIRRLYKRIDDYNVHCEKRIREHEQKYHST